MCVCIIQLLLSMQNVVKCGSLVLKPFVAVSVDNVCGVSKHTTLKPRPHTSIRPLRKYHWHLDLPVYNKQSLIKNFTLAIAWKRS